MFHPKQFVDVFVGGHEIAECNQHDEYYARQESQQKGHHLQLGFHLLHALELEDAVAVETDEGCGYHKIVVAVFGECPGQRRQEGEPEAV